MCIKDDEVTLYPIGLDQIPKRDEWRLNAEKKGSPPPVYVAAAPLAPHLIEGPIMVSRPAT